MPADEPLDSSTVQKLRRLGGDEFARQMIDIFLDFVPNKLAEARKAKEEANLKGLEKAVHAVKSSAGNLGAARFRDLASRIESLARETSSEAAWALLPELLDEFQRVKSALETAKTTLGRNPA